MRRIAIGDIHGCLDCLIQLLEVKIQIKKTDKVFVLGDIISKGPQNGDTIDYILRKNKEGFNIQGLRGNHEEQIIMLFDSDFDMLLEYLEKYNATDLLNDMEKYLQFLYQLPFYIDEGDWLLIHSYIGFQNVSGARDLRNIFGTKKIEKILNAPNINNKRQAFGHLARSLNDIKSDALNKNSRIGLDGGCVYENFGYLVGMDLDTFDLFFVKNTFHQEL